MMTHLVTGYAGYEHIQSEDDGAFNAAFFGGGQYVMAFGNQFEGSIIDNNTVRILDGDGLMHGRHFRIKPNTYEDVTITTGTAGTNRVDLIVMTYKKNENDGTEQAYLEVIMGEETEGTAVTSEYTSGNILEGATFNQMPLYKVTISGVVLQDIEPLFEVIKTYKDLAEEAKAEFVKSCETHLDSLAVLDTMEEIEANTQEKQIAGALAVKELEETLKKSVSDGKTLVASAITAQGIETAADAEFLTMSDNIGLAGNARYNAGVAATKKGTVPAAGVITGHTFTSAAAGVGVAGTMPNRGAWTGATPASNGNVAIPAGYHNGSGYVSGAASYNAGVTAGRQGYVPKSGITLWFYGTQSTAGCSREESIQATVPSGYTTLTVSGTMPATGGSATYKLQASKDGGSTWVDLISQTSNAFNQAVSVSGYNLVRLWRTGHAATGNYNVSMTFG